MRKSFIRKGAAVVVAALMVLSVGSASAQTQGIERRGRTAGRSRRGTGHKAGLQGGRREDPGGMPPGEAHNQATRAARRWKGEHGSSDEAGTVTDRVAR